MCAMVSRIHMMFYILIKGYTVPENQGTHDKYNQIQKYQPYWCLIKKYILYFQDFEFSLTLLKHGYCKISGSFEKNFVQIINFRDFSFDKINTSN